MPEIIDAIQHILEWTKLKCRIQIAPEQPPYCKERDIWWASIGANIGTEKNGKNALFERPVLVIRRFYGGSILLIGPMTTKVKKGGYYFRTEHNDVTQFVDLAQIRAISPKRLIRKLGVMPEYEFDGVRRQLKNLL